MGDSLKNTSIKGNPMILLIAPFVFFATVFCVARLSVAGSSVAEKCGFKKGSFAQE